MIYGFLNVLQDVPSRSSDYHWIDQPSLINVTLYKNIVFLSG